MWGKSGIQTEEVPNGKCFVFFFLKKGVEAVTTEEQAFKDIDYAFLVGAMPRKEGMERKDLLAANVKIFKSQGEALAKYSKPNVKVREKKSGILKIKENGRI